MDEMITSSRRQGSVGEMYANQLDSVSLSNTLNHAIGLTGTSCHFVVVASDSEADRKLKKMSDW